MKIVATADLHGNLPEIPECDILLIAGDICPAWNHERSFQANWLRSEFHEWVSEISSFCCVVWTGGNHDFVLQDMKRSKIDVLGGFYLNNEDVVINGLKIWGSPLSPTFGNWAFMRDDKGLGEVWETIPADIDILMVHGPVYGHGDLVKYAIGRDPHVGSQTLRNRLEYTEFPNLKLVVTGHIHEAYGREEVKMGNNEFTIANVSYVDFDYSPVNPLMVFEL